MLPEGDTGYATVTRRKRIGYRSRKSFWKARGKQQRTLLVLPSRHLHSPRPSAQAQKASNLPHPSTRIGGAFFVVLLCLTIGASTTISQIFRCRLGYKNVCKSELNSSLGQTRSSTSNKNRCETKTVNLLQPKREHCTPTDPQTEQNIRANKKWL